MNSIYLIKSLTNMHVGSGDINIDIIDNKVQKDVTTKFPVIHSSSLKGALREHFEDKWGKQDEKIEYIFGKEGDNGAAGNYSFFEAHILTLPQRSNVKPYFNVTSPSIIKKFIETLKIFDKNNEKLKELEKFYEEIKNIDEAIVFDRRIKEEIYLEDIKAKKKENIDVPSIFEDLAIVPDKYFSEIELPVIARNALDDKGTSKNLWYEEIVPKEATFFFPMIQNEQYSLEFENILQEDIIQFGANKSIGYGFCKIRKV